MSDRHRKYYDGLEKIKTEQQVTTRVANDVLYLREQPNWSQQLEDKFIEQAKSGEVPDVTKLGDA